MHIAFNAWFLGQPDVGTGQYLRHLIAALRSQRPDLRLTLIAPPERLIDLPDGVEALPVSVRGSGHPAKLRFEQIDCAQAALAVGADLLHVPHWGSPLRSPLPVVVTIHDLIPLILPAYRGGVLARLYTGLVAASAQGAAAVITVSEASRADILERLRIPPERVNAIYEAAGIKFHPRPGSLLDIGIRQKYDLPQEYVLYLGGFDVRKNVHTLLKAYTYVRQATADAIPLVIAGALPGRLTPRFLDIPRYIREMELEPVVRLIGRADHEDLPAIYRMAKAFVYPSRYEGFGLPLLEAMACGTPVVTSTVSSPPEVVGEAGFTVDPDDARGLAGSILGLLVQENLHKEMSQKALARAAEFSWARTARETVDVYERILLRK